MFSRLSHCFWPQLCVSIYGFVEGSHRVRPCLYAAFDCTAYDYTMLCVTKICSQVGNRLVFLCGNIHRNEIGLIYLGKIYRLEI